MAGGILHKAAVACKLCLIYSSRLHRDCANIYRRVQIYGQQKLFNLNMRNGKTLHHHMCVLSGFSF